MRVVVVGGGIAGAGVALGLVRRGRGGDRGRRGAPRSGDGRRRRDPRAVGLGGDRRVLRAVRPRRSVLPGARRGAGRPGHHRSRLPADRCAGRERRGQRHPGVVAAPRSPARRIAGDGRGRPADRRGAVRPVPAAARRPRTACGSAARRGWTDGCCAPGCSPPSSASVATCVAARWWSNLTVTARGCASTASCWTPMPSSSPAARGQPRSPNRCMLRWTSSRSAARSSTCSSTARTPRRGR